MSHLKLVEKEKQDPQVLGILLEIALADMPDLPKLVRWLATPEVCEILAKEQDDWLLSWLKYKPFIERFKKLELPQAIALFEPLEQTARWIEGCALEGWETEAFIELLLEISPKREKAFRQLLEYEIKKRRDEQTAMKIADELALWVGLLKRLCS